MLSATKSVAGPMCIKVVDRFQDEVCCPIMSYPPSDCELELNLSFHCRRKAWQVLSVLRLRRLLCVPPCAVLRSVAPSCCLRRLARWCEMVQMVNATEQPRYATAMFHSNQPETIPLCAGVSRPYLPPAPNKATETVIFFFDEMFAPAAVAAAAGGSRQQQQEEAGSSSSRKQQQQ